MTLTIFKKLSKSKDNNFLLTIIEFDSISDLFDLIQI